MRVSATWLDTRYAGPILTAGLGLVLWALAQTPYALPNPSALLLVAIAYSVFVGGVGAGLASGVIGLGFLVVTFSLRDGAVVVTTGDLRRYIAFGVAAPVLVLLARQLRRMLDRLYLREREARRQAEAAERRAQYLAEVSRLLSVSLDFRVALQTVARLSTDILCDWCIIYLLEEGETVRREAIAHRDPEKLDLARQLRRFPVRREGVRYVVDVVRTGESLLFEKVTDTVLREFAQSEEHIRLIQRLGASSMMVVPLLARGEVLGAMICVATDPQRTFDNGDLDLAMDVAGRAALALDNSRLYEAALAADRAKTDFLAVMSHELRTPLTAIMGYADLLEMELYGPVMDRQKDQIERIKASSNHLLSIIEEILDYTRSEAGRMEVRVGPVDVTGVVAEAARIAHPMVEEKGLDFRVHPPEPSCTIRTDAAKVRHILTHLLTNAVNFTEKGAVTLEAECTEDGALFRVSDTGIGILPEHRERIFEPFWQAERAMTRRVGGTGLGLSVVRRLTEILGGTVEVESEPGQGSTFTVRLPDMGE